MTVPPALRRLFLVVTVPVELAVVGVLVAAMPVAAVLAVVDRRRRLLRLDVFAIIYLAVELAALARFAVLWVLHFTKGRTWYDAANRRCAVRALGQLLGAGRRCFGFRIEVDDPPTLEPMAGSGPLLVLARHGGIGDSFSLVWVLLARYGRRPRVVLKRMLLWEPLIDVALSRLGACFLPSKAPDRPERIAMLTRDLQPEDALLVFPEGGNWTPDRRQRAISHLRAARKRRAAAAAELMEHVLPPRPAGVVGCLRARPDIAIVVVAHTGLDTITSVRDAWRALPFRTGMQVRWWTPPPPPEDDDARVQWLTNEWAIVDEWIDAHRPPACDRIAEASRT